MLVKLIKHEYIYLAKTFTPIYIIFLISAILVRLFAGIDMDFDDNALSYTLVAVVFCVTMIFGGLCGIMAFLTVIDNVRRFKKNMFSDEGYLTNTLPVTATEHIVAKLIAGATNYILSFVVLLIGVMIVEKNASISILKAFYEFITDKEVDLSIKLSAILLGFLGYICLLLLGYLLSALNSMINGKGCLSGIVASAVLIFVVFSISRIFGLMVDSEYFPDHPTAAILVFCGFFAAGAAVMYLLIVNIIKNHLTLQ
ncbi:MAG: hypothetical protein IJ170_10905 [Ruminococcus sp.]|nr:hypothetical protein [Ruminococcus sp.]